MIRGWLTAALAALCLAATAATGFAAGEVTDELVCAKHRDGGRGGAGQMVHEYFLAH